MHIAIQICSFLDACMQAITINEFHAPRWSQPYVSSPGQPTVDLGRFILGETDLDSYGLWVLIGIGALISYVVFYNIVICLAMKYLSCELLIHCLWCVDTYILQAHQTRTRWQPVLIRTHSVRRGVAMAWRPFWRLGEELLALTLLPCTLFCLLSAPCGQ